MDKLVNLHYVDKDAFFNINTDNDEEVLVFDTSPTYEEILGKVTSVLKWMNPNNVVKLVGRYDVGVGSKSRLKTMPITSDLQCNVYKAKVAGSEDNSLELFATKFEGPSAEMDLKRFLSSQNHEIK